MKTKFFFLLLFSGIFFLFTQSFSQVQMLSLDKLDGWQQTPGSSAASIELGIDEESQFEGDGALRITVAHTGDVGNWTNIYYNFPEPLDITGATDLRFMLKVTRRTTNNRSIQFTCDIFDSVAGQSRQEMWRWAEDRDVIYTTGAASWHEVVIPISRMSIAHWDTPVNDVKDLNSIVQFAVGLHSLGTPDTVTIEIDDLKATGTNEIAQILNCDQADVWTTFNNSVAENVVTVAANEEDVYEGDGSLDVLFDMESAPAGWGSVAYIEYIFPQPIDLTGATELRYWMKILDGPKIVVAPEQTIATVDQLAFWDLVDLSTGSETWRYIPGGALGLIIDETLHLKKVYPELTVPKWCEYSIPLADFDINSWDTHVDSVLDLNAITAIRFGVGHLWQDAPVDTIHVLIDNIYASSAGNLTDVEEPQNPLNFSFRLDNNYPNPFNPSTNISFQLPDNGNVSLKIYDLTGKEVYTVIDNTFKIRGSYNYSVNLNNLASGIYFYTLRQNDNVQTKKMTLLK